MVRVHSEHCTGLLPWNKRGAGGVEIGWDMSVRLGMILLAVLHRDRVALKTFSLDANKKGRATPKEGINVIPHDFLSNITWLRRIPPGRRWT